MKRAALFLAILALPAAGQKLDPITWSATLTPSKAAPGSKILARISAKIEPGWHLYSLSVPRPIRATAILVEHETVASSTVYFAPPKRAFDPNFGFDTETYENSVDFLVEVALKADAAEGAVELPVKARYQTCNDKMCLPPVTRTALAALAIDAKSPPSQPAIPPEFAKFVPGAQKPAAPAAAPKAAGAEGLGEFLGIAFGFGLLALFTPCVFPMIPITMSHFLNKPAGGRAASLIDAGVFCLGIVALFTSLGIAATALLGPFGVVLIGSNVWVNTFISIVFLAFGLSLLGAFELTIPSSVLTKLDGASQRGGFAGTLLMGLTFSLTSFACVGPFVGPLLAASVTGGKVRPVLGMMAFASGLSLPFFLLAAFPAYLKRLPRSGAWMSRVKIVMGFLILATMLKYLSGVDQVMQWGFLTRERFLAAWVVLFAMAGLYLLGFLRLDGIRPEDSLGVPRLLIGAAFLIFAVSLIPGMFGGALGELDAYVPLSAKSAASPGSDAGLVWMKNQYRDALDRARRESKFVFVNFTGYACTNCHWMKANMFPRPEIAAAMKDFVLVELYTDGVDEASRANQELEEKKFATIAIPFYAILDPDEKVIATFPGLTKKPAEFLAFLRTPAS